MRNAMLLLLAASLLCGFCPQQGGNPFFSDYDTPFKVPPFEKIKEAHYLPAFKAGVEQQKKEVQDIINTKAAPTFDNTILALEESGALLTKVGNVFFNLTSAHTNDELQEIAKEVTPLLAAHVDDINLNAKLFQRVKAVYEQRERLGLNKEQAMLLEKNYKGFVRGGANLNDSQKEVMRAVNQELSMLTLTFGDNLLKANAKFEMVLESEADLVGLPEAIVIGATETAKARGHEGKWVFTLDKPSWIPFLTYSPRRDLREKLYKGYITRCDKNDELDNKANLAKISALRSKKAQLLGYETHAHFVLEENMAQTPDQVYELLDQLWKPALNIAKTEVYEMQSIIFAEGNNFQLQSWDWWYYADKVKTAKYALDDEAIRPYLKLENVRDGAFDLANKLWGITFTELKDMPIYQEDVKVFEVKEADGAHIGILYVDYFPRASKRGGAWMNSYRKQMRIRGSDTKPVIVNCGNFSKPTGGKPALLSFEEVTTLFHEFGHALHGLLSNSSYPTLTGTSVPRDFVELPSQIMENWANHPEYLKTFAKHYETGETIPQELIDKMDKAKYFNQGFITIEYLAASYLDMNWHTLTSDDILDPVEYETNALNKMGLIPEIIPRYRSTYFQHIFSGGYSSGYYSYIWAAVLDADAFEAFKENGILDQATAASYRKNILETGGSDKPMDLYVRFRGAKPKIDPLLARRGLK